MGHLTEIQKNVFGNAIGLQGAIPTEVDFGSPKNPDCYHFGICRVYSLEGKAMRLLPSCCPGRAQGYIRRWERRGVELIFPAGNMAPATLEKHFGTGWFTVEYAYEVPAAIAAAIGLHGFTFQPGRYPVLEDGHGLRVVFD